jgi:hypothetical protein
LIRTCRVLDLAQKPFPTGLYRMEAAVRLLTPLLIEHMSMSHRRTISPFCVLDLGKFHMADAITAAEWPFARAIGSFLEFEKYPRPGLAIFFYLRTHECRSLRTYESQTSVTPSFPICVYVAACSHFYHGWKRIGRTSQNRRG